MMSEMEEDVRVMVVTEENRVALGDKPCRPHVACLTMGLGMSHAICHDYYFWGLVSSFSFDSLGRSSQPNSPLWGWSFLVWSYLSFC